MASLHITEEKEVSLFNRKEVKGTMHAEKFPSREEISNTMSEKFSVPAGNIQIKKIKGNFGTSDFQIEANIYHSDKDKKFLEVKKKKDSKEKK